MDALDEINDQGGSAFLKELLDTTNRIGLRGLKFLVASRPCPKITDLCASFPPETVCHLCEVPRATVKADMIKYLEALGKLSKLREYEGLSNLADKADGLFIYAAIAVKYILPRSRMTKREQKKLLDKLLASPHTITY